MSIVAIFPRAPAAPTGWGRVRPAGSAVVGRLARVLSSWRARRGLQPVPDYLLDDVGLSRGQAQQIREHRRRSFGGGAMPGHYFC